MQMNIGLFLWGSLAAGLLALAFAWWKAQWIGKQDPGTDRMREIGGSIRSGAMAFLKREYTVIAVAVILVAILLAAINTGAARWVAAAFVLGAVCSGLSGFFGMRVATAANMRTANAARKGLPEALRVAFSGGSVMGMCVVGLGLAGLAIALLATFAAFHDPEDIASVKDIIMPIVTGFSMGPIK